MTETITPDSNRSAPTFRGYRPGDEERILELLVEAFDGWPSYDLAVPAVDHWRWRYLGRGGGEQMLVIGEHDGRVMASVHYTLVDLQIGDRSFRTALGGDIAVRQSYRGRGLLAELTRQGVRRRYQAGCIFTYFESQVPKVIRYFRRNSIQLPLNTRHLLRARSIRRHLQRQGHRLVWPKAAGFAAMRALERLAGARLRHPAGNLRVTTVSRFEGRFDALWQELSGAYRLIVRRDAAFLNWRYADPRSGSFRVRCIEERGRLLGYCVARINRRSADYPVGYLVDLLCLPGREDAAAALIRDALEAFDSEQINAVHCMVPGRHPYRRLLAACGFVDTLERNIVFLRPGPGAPDVSSLLDSIEPAESWYSYGDIDTI